MEETVIHCNVKENAELIARILDYDVNGERFLHLEPPYGTLTADLPVDFEPVERINPLNSDTHIYIKTPSESNAICHFSDEKNESKRAYSYVTKFVKPPL